MRVDIWSEVVCPRCYLGKSRFEKALAAFAEALRRAAAGLHRPGSD